MRRIDELGRVVIPKEIRRTQRIPPRRPAGDLYHRGRGGDLQKYSPIGEMSNGAAQYTEVLNKSFALTAFVADRDHILAVSGAGRRELADRSISQPLEKLMDGRRPTRTRALPKSASCPAKVRPEQCCAPHPSLRRAM